jgi:release factor glutamine methyltransferase
MLEEALREQVLPPRACALDLFTGSGAVAVAAAQRGARDVWAVDVSRRAVLTARLNARLNGVRVKAVRGSLFEPLGKMRFDAITANPPYVPAEREALPTRGAARAVDAGLDGRTFIDRLCEQAPDRLRPGGFLLVVHSSICGTDRTVELLRDGGLEVDVVLRRRGPLGPLMSDRARTLEERGLLRPGQREEDVVVVRGRRPGRAIAARPMGARAEALV